MMKYKDTMTACDPHSLLRRMPPEEYINRLSDNMVKELCDTGKCGMMVEIVENIRDAYLYAQVKAIAYAACKLNDHLTAAVAQRDAGRMELQQARMDAARIRREAQLEAQNILANAEQERRKAMLLHNETVQREREQILEAARREAEAVREKLIEDARREAHEVYQELQGRFTPRAVSDAIEGYRREESAACAALAEQHRRKVNSFEETRTQLSSGMTGLQAQLMQQLSEMQSSISRSMMDWREQLYRLETMDLAQCAVNLSTILAGVDKRIGDAATQGDAAMVETLSSVRRNLARFEKQYRNALGAVGLEVYQPQPGEAFDPARHVLGDAEKDFDPDKPLTVTGCIRPGVLAGREALIRAEVNAKEAPAESAAPKFSQIVPGGDQK